ncbi:hypothetical protein ACQY0O_004458 [Thecaphora frezii]
MALLFPLLCHSPTPSSPRPFSNCHPRLPPPPPAHLASILGIPSTLATPLSLANPPNLADVKQEPPRITAIPPLLPTHSLRPLDMSLRREARDFEKAVQMSRVGSSSGDRDPYFSRLPSFNRIGSPAIAPPKAALPLPPQAAGSPSIPGSPASKENIPTRSSYGFAPPPPPSHPLYRRETERSALSDNIAPSSAAPTGSSRMSSVSPSLHPPSTGLDSVTTPPPMLSSPPTTAYASSVSFYGPAPNLKEAVQTPATNHAASLVPRASIASSAKSDRSEASASAKRKRALAIEDSEDEGPGFVPSSREATPSAAAKDPIRNSADNRSNCTEIFVDLPTSIAKRSKSDVLLDVSSEASTMLQRRKSTEGRNDAIDSPGSTTTEQDRKRKQRTELDDAAFAAQLAMEEGVAVRRASRAKTKPVNYAPVCDKDGRPLKTASSSSSSKKPSSDKAALETKAGSKKKKGDRATRIRDDEETDEEDWQSSHSIGSPARARTVSTDGEIRPRNDSASSGAQSSNRQGTASTAPDRRASAKASEPSGSLGAQMAEPPSAPIVVDDHDAADTEEPVARRSKRTAEKLQREAEAKAARKKAREERKRKEAEERGKTEAEAQAQAQAQLQPQHNDGAKKGGKTKTKGVEGKAFDLSTSPKRPTAAKAKRKGDADGAEAAAADSAAADGIASTAAVVATTPEPPARNGKAIPVATSTGDQGASPDDEVEDEPLTPEGSATSPPKARSDKGQAAGAEAEPKAQPQPKPPKSAAPASPEPATLATPVKAKDATPSTPAATTQRSSTCAPASHSHSNTLVQTPTVSIVHRSSSTPLSRPSTPGSSFAGKPLSTLLTPGSSRYGAVRRPGLTRTVRIPSLLHKSGPPPPPRPPPPVKKKKRGDEDDYEWDEAYERLMGRVKDEDEEEEEEREALDEEYEEVMDEY